MLELIHIPKLNIIAIASTNPKEIIFHQQQK